MIPSTTIQGFLQHAFAPTKRGIVGLTEQLLEACVGREVVFKRVGDTCVCRWDENGETHEAPAPLPPAAFRTILARIAALCNEHRPYSVTPYCGEGLLAINGCQSLRVAFVNTTSEQQLKVGPEADRDERAVMTTAPVGYDLFVSHATPDKPWVRTLNEELIRLGLRPYFDANELQPADNFVAALGEGLVRSRFLVVVLTAESAERLWVVKEWTTFMAIHGPHGRVIPVLLDAIELPPMLKTCQGIWASDRDAARVAAKLAERIGKPGEVQAGDTRELYFGQDLAFHLAPDTDGWHMTGPDGRERLVPTPLADRAFGQSLIAFRRLARQATETDADRTSLHHNAVTLGRRLFDTLIGVDYRETLNRATVPNRPRPLLTIRSHDDSVLALPWELVHDGQGFLVGDKKLDVARSTPGETHPHPIPQGQFNLVVNVSAPGDRRASQLDYEHESYRITRALEGRCRMTPTELGTLDDLVQTVRIQKPRGIHFSGHGAPGVLVFENAEGDADRVPVSRLVAALRSAHPDGQLPPFFYLASCHGSDPGADVAESTAAALHRAGVDQVVGYHGPIVDALSTRCEAELYGGVAAGDTTRCAIQRARDALQRPVDVEDDRHREPGEATTAAGNRLFPFAWRNWCTSTAGWIRR